MLYSWLHLLSGCNPVPEQGQHEGDEQHGRDQETFRPEKQQAGKRAQQARQRGKMVFGSKPLLCEGSNKQRGHGEFNADGGKGQDAAQQAARNAAQNPVGMIEQGDQETEQIRICPLRRASVAQKGVGLVCKGKDQIRFIPAGVFIAPDHGDTVEKMACVDHDGGESCYQNGGSALKQANPHKLHGTGKHQQAHGENPEDSVSGTAGQDSETHAQDEISSQNRK